MRFAEQGGEGQGEDLLAVAVCDVQHPAAPVFRTRRHDQRARDERGVLARVSEVVDGGAASIQTMPLARWSSGNRPEPSAVLTKTKCRAGCVAAAGEAEIQADSLGRVTERRDT